MSRNRDLHAEIEAELAALQELKATLDARIDTPDLSELAGEVVAMLNKGKTLLQKAASKDAIKARSKLAVKGCERILEALQLSAGSEDIWGRPEVDDAHFQCQEAILADELHSSNLEDSAASVMYRTLEMLHTQERVIKDEKTQRQLEAGEAGALRGIEMRIKACDRADISDSGQDVAQRIKPWLKEMGPMIRAREEGGPEILEAYGDLIRLRYRVFEEIIRGPENLASLSAEEAGELMNLFSTSEPPSDLSEARQSRSASMVGLKTRLD